MPNNIYQLGFNNHLTKPPLLKLPSAARHGFSDGVDPSKISFNNPFFNQASLKGKVITVTPGKDIQKAVDIINDAGGGEVFLENGTHVRKANLNLYSNVFLRGESTMSAILDFDGGAYGIRSIGTNIYTAGTLSVNDDSATVTGVGTAWTTAMAGRSIALNQTYYTIASVESATSLTLSSAFSGSNLSAVSYIIVDPVFDLNISNMTVQNSAGTLVQIQHCINGSLRNLQVGDGGQAIDLDDCNLFYMNLVDVYNCSTGTTIDNCRAFGYESFSIYDITAGAGLAITGGGDASIFDFGIDNCAGNGIIATDINDIGFTSYVISQCTGKGIEYVAGCVDNMIISGLIDSCGSDGFKITATSDRNIISSSSITNNTGYGINIAAATCDKNIILGNSFDGNGTAPINNSGTSTTIQANTGATNNLPIQVATDISSRTTSSYQEITEISYTVKATVLIDGVTWGALGYTECRLVARLGYSSGTRVYGRLTVGANNSDVDTVSNELLFGNWIAFPATATVYDIYGKVSTAGTSYMYAAQYVELR